MYEVSLTHIIRYQLKQIQKYTQCINSDILNFTGKTVLETKRVSFVIQLLTKKSLTPTNILGIMFELAQKTRGGARNVIPFYNPIKIATSQYRCCKRAIECCSSRKMRQMSPVCKTVILDFLYEMFNLRVMSHRFSGRHEGGKLWPPYSPDINPQATEFIF